MNKKKAHISMLDKKKLLVKKIIFQYSFKKTDLPRVWSLLWQKLNSERAKHLRICPSIGGNMPQAQI